MLFQQTQAGKTNTSNAGARTMDIQSGRSTHGNAALGHLILFSNRLHLSWDVLSASPLGLNGYG